MSDQDRVQKSHVTHIKYTIAATVLTVTFQRGPGVLARTGAGTLTLTYPAGSDIDVLRQSTVARIVGATWGHAQATATSDTVISIAVTDAAAMALDNVPGVIDVYAILGG